MKRLAVVIMLAMLVFACSEGKDAEPITKKEADINPMEEISLAKVNGSPITAEDLRMEFNLLSGQAQQMFMSEGGFESLLDELVKKELLYQEAKKKNYTSDEEFKKIMDDYKKRIMIGFLLREEVEEKSVVSDSEIKKYYDDNKKDFILEAPEKGATTAVDFESVKNLIRQQMESQKETEIFDSFIGQLRESYTVEINNEAFNSTFGNITSPSLENEPQGE